MRFAKTQGSKALSDSSRERHVAGAMKHSSAGPSVGATIRQARRKSGLTLTQLANKADFSISYLSQIERNLLIPSISTLKRIADLLKIPAGELMFGAGNGGKLSAVQVVRRDARKRVTFPGSNIQYELLTPDLRRRSSLIWLIAAPGSESGSAFMHEGEDGVVMLKGSLEIEIGGMVHQLNVGDSIYFNAALPHRWRNAGTEPAEAIWLSTPPSF
jgi:transcriptional regulator with XRE-family HTH domain